MSGGSHRPHVSSDRTMSKWPIDINAERDSMSPYPCQTCKVPFRSCKKLATHKCVGVRKYKPQLDETETGMPPVLEVTDRAKENV